MKALLRLLARARGTREDKAPPRRSFAHLDQKAEQAALTGSDIDGHHGMLFVPTARGIVDLIASRDFDTPHYTVRLDNPALDSHARWKDLYRGTDPGAAADAFNRAVRKYRRFI